MGRLGRWAALAVLAAGMLHWPLACSQQHNPPPPPATAPRVRVRLLAAQEQVVLRGSLSPTVKTETETAILRVNLPPQSDVSLTLVENTWQIGGVTVPGHGELTLWQSEDATVSVAGKMYRGSFRFVPTGANTFDVVNDVDIDGYLKSVVRREMLSRWGEETYKAQAIVARTYALYEAKTVGRKRHWDLYPDDRSQMYGGYDDESAKARQAVEETAGVVVAYGERGRERIFKSYFSSCCGGITQSAADAFGEACFIPLSDQNQHGLCSAADNYNWGPVEISKKELTRRLRAYGQRRNRSEKNIELVNSVEVEQSNRFERSIRFAATDVKGARFSLGGEELRNAINSGSSKESPARLPSSFVKVVSDPSSEVIRFVEGHGLGHGVGMCQWCSEIRCEAGMRHEDIVLSAFPKARLVRAY